MEYEQIKKIINDMSQSHLNSLNIEFPDGVKISLTKDSSYTESIDRKEIEQVPQQQEKNEESTNIYTVKSPMVGTLYLKPSPDKAPYVNVGDTVKKGQVICIIEAMKLMNEIESEYDGKIVEICTQNEEMVEYGKPIFKIEEV